MSDDDFKAVFFEEAAEHLQAIEDELLILDAEPDNAEALNAVFRAAHSIKGSAGMFGFNTLADFTHHLETLLDLIRKGKASLTDERVELTLQAADEIRALVDQLSAGEEAPPADPELTQALQAAVEDAAGGSQPSQEPSEDDSFGLFEDEVESSDDSYGLFEDEPAEDDDSFGLFEQDAEADDSFGLFEDEPETEAPAQSAYAGYFDEMLRDNDAEQAEANSSPGDEPEPTRTEPDEKVAASEPAPTDVDPAHDDPDGKFGWLNRPEQTPAPAATPAKSAARTSDSRKRDSGGSLRVSLDKVDELVNQISELVITQAMLQETAAGLDPVATEKHLATLETLERNTRELQESVLSIRLIPVSFLFSRFPRVVRDLARKLGKEVDLQLIGEQTELDKSLIEKLSDPLTHLVRNSIDHGVEHPDRREAAGKPRIGQVVMAAAHEGGNIVISISDDGGGINRDKVLAKARENGLPVEDTWSDEQVYALIFEPGFSTAAEVTDVSGRGVGMDVVKRNIKELGGTIEVNSTAGQGSVFTVRLPLTLAITDGMVVRCDDQRYVIPLSNVVESLQLSADEIFEIQGRSRVIRRHGDFLPLKPLAALLEPEADHSGCPEELAIVVESEGQQIGLVVDELIGQQQIVIKNLESNYRKVLGFSGATVMGDGSVAFILDIAHLVSAGSHPSVAGPASHKESKTMNTPATPEDHHE